MKNKAEIVLSYKDIEMITVKCPQFKIIYVTNYSSAETDVCFHNETVIINVFVTDSFEDTLSKVSEKVKKVNESIDDGCDLVYTL